MDHIGNRRLLGASVMPFAVDQQHNNLYILLGSERHQPRWHESGRFSDFGGTSTGKESPEECAAREFFEETGAILRDTVPELASVETIKEMLEAQKFSFRITTIIDDERYYVTFVKQIDFDASISADTHTCLKCCVARDKSHAWLVFMFRVATRKSNFYRLIRRSK